MDRHSLQSPFIYDLYTKVIHPKKKPSLSGDIEKAREKLKCNNTLLHIDDFGSGSQVDNSKKRKVSDIAMKGISQKKHSELFYRLIDYLQAKNILELGTSLGINTMYLAESKGAKVTTFEGSGALSKHARNLFRAHNRSNIDVISGNIDMTLPAFLKESETLDLVYFDANHLYQPTINYFNWCKSRSHKNSCFIFDDIYLSKEMTKAWKEIRTDHEVTVSIDLFQVGIVFFNPDITKQHFVLEY